MTHIKALARLRTFATKEFNYGLVNRPPGLGAVPKGQVRYDPSNQGIDGVRHGVITYDRELTAQEIKSFELLPLSGDDGKPLEAPKFPDAVLRKAREAIESLNYAIEEDLDESDEDVKAEMDKHRKTLDTFRSYARSKHLDASKALKELGYKGKM